MGIAVEALAPGAIVNRLRPTGAAATQAERPSEAPLNVALIWRWDGGKPTSAPCVIWRRWCVCGCPRHHARAGAGLCRYRRAWGGVGDVVAYPDLEALIADAALDSVIVLTPPNARQAIVEGLCAAGCRS